MPIIKRIGAIALFLTLMLSLPLMAQDKISVESTVDKQEITIGDLVQYRVTITADTSLVIDSLVVGASLGMFEIKDYLPREERVRDGYCIITEAFTITTFTTGEYEIPSLTIKYRTAGGESKSIATDPLPILVKSLLTGEEAEDIKPLKVQRSFTPDTPWWLIITGALLLAAIAVFVILYRRARKPIELTPEKIDTRLPWEIALEQLRQLQDEELIAKGEYKLFYLALSEIFRRYLERRYGIKCLECTTWEIVVAFRELGLSDTEESVIRDFLDDCDLVKFAKFQPAIQQTDGDLARARDFVMQTRSLPYSSTTVREH
ncbi:MAG: hypothetical protein KAT58_12115 [candidate division Zixibacteria bacterium]|nr:hypothetical protein [candidate division Zixibacteria bacterium]